MTKEVIKSVEAAAREVPVLKCSALLWQSEGFAWREAMVRLAKGVTLQDLNDHPKVLWKNIQGNRQTSLRQWDKLRIVSFAADWFVDATVSYADGDQVILAGIKKTDLPARTVALFEDENYKVDWLGSGYGVVRKSDGQMMGHITFSRPEEARAHLMSFYPKKVA